MKYSKDEVLQYVKEDDVKFIRLAFCDIFGKQKNISIMPEELPQAFEYGIAFDASSVEGFENVTHSDLFLRPNSDTLTALPWRPEHGKVVRMFSDIVCPTGDIYEGDTRCLLKKAIAEADKAGISFVFGAEQKFYLFELDENGKPTKKTYDKAGYLDIAPDDKGENIRREICLTLEAMGIQPESSHHEAGPGQNEIDFCNSDPLTAADNVMTFQTVVRTVAHRNGLYADFSPKPVEDAPGNGFHINISVNSADTADKLPSVIAGILEKIPEMTAFMNPTTDSYKRFGNNNAPQYIAWSPENRSQLVRVPATFDENKRAELRSPDPTANPYLAFMLIIYAGLSGIKKGLTPPPAAGFNAYDADQKTVEKYKRLPNTLKEAFELASKSKFIEAYVPKKILNSYFFG